MTSHPTYVDVAILQSKKPVELPEKEKAILKDWLQKASVTGTVIFKVSQNCIFLYSNSVFLCSEFLCSEFLYSVFLYSVFQCNVFVFFVYQTIWVELISPTLFATLQLSYFL